MYIKFKLNYNMSFSFFAVLTHSDLCSFHNSMSGQTGPFWSPQTSEESEAEPAHHQSPTHRDQLRDGAFAPNKYEPSIAVGDHW